MLHLKQQGIVHADIKLENILYQKSSKRFKLSDFGAALNYGRHFNRLRGTYSILSPEIYGEFLYSSSSDMWALATEMLSAVSGSWAFKASKKDFWDIPQQWQHWLGPMPEDIQRTLAARKFNVSQTNTLPAIDRLFSKPSDPLKDFIKRALAYDYRHRLTVEEALNHEFLL